jgi:methylamine dehydrogenase accessory protein MauD
VKSFKFSNKPYRKGDEIKMENIVIANLVLLWVVVLFNLLLIIALVRRINKLPESLGRPVEMLNVGDVAPDFRVETLDGQIITQADYLDRQHLMIFVSPSCGVCKEQMPKLQDLYPQARRSGIELMVISLANIEETRVFADAHKFTEPIYAVSKGINPIGRDYKVAGTPQYYLIDEQRKIQAADFFGYEWEQLIQKWAID